MLLPKWHKSTLLKIPACRKHLHGRTNQNSLQDSCAWEEPVQGSRQGSSHPSNAQLDSEALILDQGILEHTAKGRTHPVGELDHVAEQNIPPVKEKPSQRCLWDFWEEHRKEKQSRDCPWRISCQCYGKISAYRMLFSARWVLFSLQGDFLIKMVRWGLSHHSSKLHICIQFYFFFPKYQ